MVSTPSIFSHACLSALQVKDTQNFDFVMKLLSNVGVIVPPISYVERALAEVAKSEYLLGEMATGSQLEAWAGVIFDYSLCWNFLDLKSLITGKNARIVQINLI